MPRLDQLDTRLKASWRTWVFLGACCLALALVAYWLFKLLVALVVFAVVALAALWVLSRIGRWSERGGNRNP